MPKIKTLLVEDSPTDAVLVAREVRDVAVVDVAINRAEFLKMLDETWDVCLVDLDLVDLKGAEVIQLAKEKYPLLPVIIVTGSVSEKQADAACDAGASRFFMKKVDGVPGLARALVQVHEAARIKREAEQLGQQAMRDQRLEILGQLSTGIVHDFNGILAVVMMGAEQLRIDPTNSRVLDAMLSAAKRGAEMTAQVLAFVRGTNGAVFKNISPEYLLGQIRQLMATTFPPNIRIEVETALGTSDVKGDTTQLAQVLANLVTNARDAMPKGGTLKIMAQNIARVPEIDGPCVEFAVIDSGTGIPDDVLPHVWTPFFSTKAPGFGTGLGLPTVKRIVEAHHGVVKLFTGPFGTSFHVHLPASVPGSIAASEVKAQDLDGRGRTVLLVDDQQSFRDLAAMILEGANYKVLQAANGPEALSYFRGCQHIEAVITDLAMSPMTGDELARNLRSSGLTVPIIYLSGYDANLTRDPEPQAVLQKPVNREQLLNALAKVLSHGDNRASAAILQNV